jgi:hypothetical protein
MVEASGKHWFVMMCQGDALKYVRIHHEEGTVYKIWNELKTRYDGVEHNNLEDLYAKVVDTINNGPRDEDPLLCSPKAFFVKKYGYKYFSGNCRECGQQGHKAVDCPDKKEAAVNYKPAPSNVWKAKQEGKKPARDISQVTCYICQKKGRYARECRGKKVLKNETFFVGCVGVVKPTVNGVWDICEYHHTMNKHGRNWWETRKDSIGIYENDSDMELFEESFNKRFQDKNSLCVGACVECKTQTEI